MIETFFGADLLTSAPALFSALIIGIAFGWCLEQAGFGSSRKLTGIFYFRDMAVLKVMFSAVVTAMLGLLLLFKLGLLRPESVFMPETFFGAQIIGGLLFGFGFVIGGWCPGTAAVGAVSGKFDAIVFLFGAVVGSMAFSESYALVEPCYQMGSAGLRFIYDDLGLSYAEFALLMTVVAVAAFWFSELIETRFDFSATADKTRGLWVFSFALLIAAAGISTLPTQLQGGASNQTQILAAIESAQDHIDAVDLAKELVAGEKKIVCIDLRSAEEYEEWHIPGARRFPLESLVAGLNRYKNYDRIVLYSNGMVHPAQVWVVLQQHGFKNAFVLAEGLQGLFEQVLKPAALRVEPLTPDQAKAIEQWRSFFLTSANAVGAAAPVQFEP